ncbi:MAG: M20/M25/M40 family metallo-hydrolase [Myxococcota bacterium]
MRTSPIYLALLCACGQAAPPSAGPVLVAKDSDPEAAQRYKRFLAEYLQVDTTSPPGNEARAVPLLRAALEDLGLRPETTTIAEGRANVMAILEATHPDPGAGPLILLHHIDVVPAEAARWSVPPFQGLVRDQKLWGRGAIDMKSLAALHLFALDRLRRTPERLRRSVIFLAVADEETFGLGAQRFVAEGVPRFHPEYVLDEGGFSIRHFLGDHDVAVVAVAEKRTSKLRLTVRGAGGHGSRPLPDGAPNLLARALVRVLDAPPPMRIGPYSAPIFEALSTIAPFPKSTILARIQAPGVLGLLEGGLSADKNLNPILRDTLALTMLEGSDKANVIPSEASAIFDARLLPDTDVEALLRTLNAKVADLGGSFSIVDAPLPASAPSPTEDPLFAAIEAGLRAQAPATTITPWLLIGASDSRFFRQAGLKAYGFNPIFLEKAALDGIHGLDEAVPLESLGAGMRTYAEVLERFLLRP